MDRKKDIMQQKVVDLDRGLFCVQYQSADDETSPPKVVVSPAPGHESEVEFFLHPDADQAVLWQPGSSLILRTSAAAQASCPGCGVAPERVESGCREIRSADTGHADFTVPMVDGILSPDNGTDMRLLGHVAGIGDVVVGPSEWLAGPTAPSRIEGIAIEWPQKPGGLDLRYAVKSANQPGTPKLVGLQSFAGTRQRALPITSIVLELSGPAASNYQLWAEALFLSSPILRAIGQRVVLSGPTGREPLVGLRIAIQSTEISDEPDLSAPVTAVVNKTSSSKGKVRVFRSRPKQGAAID